MQAIVTRNLFHLYRSALIIAALCFLVSQSSFAQSSKGNYNFLEFQAKPYYFGITLGYNSSDFKITHSKNFISNDSIDNASSITGPGFNLGIVSNLKIGQYFDFRFLPTLSFTERNLNYIYLENDRPVSNRKVESVLVELPFQARYKSAPYNDIRLFMIMGVKYSFDVASDSRARQANSLVKISPTDFALEYGAGIQFFFPYFIFSPEIKISNGLGNVLIFNKEVEESNVLEKIRSRALTISLHFEG